ncbi:uncharacterized protein [Paramormyrops kingsleyae]|uniref:uncharacterized protein n=1 Tax=Paramormyrops kingsleyae TaxID=1676925 RepID=UPI003B97579D
MRCTQALIFCLLVGLVQGQRDCSQNVRWGDLLEDLNILSRSISIDCGSHDDKTSLCDAQKMLNMLQLNARAVDSVIQRILNIYKKHHNSSKFVERLLHTLRNLECASEFLEGNLEPVTECFEKLETFLEIKKSHRQCALEIVTANTREILQRMQNRTVRKR